MPISDIAIYFDISEFLQTRKTTGIQRVIRELLTRAIQDIPNIFILDIDTQTDTFILLDNQEFPSFFQDIKNYTFVSKKAIDLSKIRREQKIFFDLDTIWNSSKPRELLYPQLKENNFYIFNLIYDLIPILFPNYLYTASRENFPAFIASVYKFSDLVLFNSNSTKRDFFELQKKLHFTNNIKTAMLPLGSDYAHYPSNKLVDVQNLLATKYILFVGTIEPRKEQLKVLEVYEEIYKNHQDIHLVFIGKIGWGVDSFVDKFSKHPLKEKKIHHLTEIDDATLALFYKEAYLVVYLSKYEGYGLPLVESLAHSNVTITSKNSSMSEFSPKLVDFVDDDSKEALYRLLNSYIENPHLVNLRRKEIQANYKTTTWNDFYANLINIIENFDILTSMSQNKGDYT